MSSNYVDVNVLNLSPCRPSPSLSSSPSLLRKIRFLVSYYPSFILLLSVLCVSHIREICSLEAGGSDLFHSTFWSGCKFMLQLYVGLESGVLREDFYSLWSCSRILAVPCFGESPGLTCVFWDLQLGPPDTGSDPSSVVSGPATAVSLCPCGPLQILGASCFSCQVGSYFNIIPECVSLP